MASPTIKIKTKTEELLYQHYSEEKAHREKLEQLVHSLSHQVETLQQELKKVSEQKKPEAPARKETPEKVEYETDEEELARETEWIRQQSRKKRKLNSTLTPPHHGPNSKESDDQPKPKKVPPPPPIVVEDIKNYQSFYDSLISKHLEDSFSIKMMSGQSVKINAKDDNSYRAITSHLSQNKYCWHSYENKQERPIRVMAKQLHFSCEPEKIVEYLSDKGFKIIEAVNKLRWKNKEPLNMFMLSFEKNEDIKKIYGIKCILGCKVEIQALKTSKLIPQCKKCQAYGHTQKYCSKEPRCVKCTGKHLTRDCTKPTDAKPKCVHCGEAHPANYRGCTIAKELQKLKSRKHITAEPHQSKKTNNTRVQSAQRASDNISYAQVTKNDKSQPQQLHEQLQQIAVEDKINRILSLMSSFDERLKKLESSAKNALAKPTK